LVCCCAGEGVVTVVDVTPVGLTFAVEPVDECNLAIPAYDSREKNQF
jgi:hypothetical protein